MRIYRHWSDLSDDARGAVIAIGNFDGVHLGHRQVIKKAANIARKSNLPLGVMTFEPHPRAFLGKEITPFRITPFRAKVDAISKLGVDILYVIKFDKKFANLSPKNFISEIIVEGLEAKHVVIGYDFAFGSNRGGNIKLLESLSLSGGYSVHEVLKAQDEKGPFSASAIRECIHVGDVESATKILGRQWEIMGRVKGGDRIGRTMGFPTANLSVSNILKPASGIYAVWASVKHLGDSPEQTNKWYRAAAYVGRRPTFDKTEELLETHIFDFDAEIYGQLLRVAFVSRIRGDQKFDDQNQLSKQMDNDCLKAKEILLTSSPPSL